MKNNVYDTKDKGIELSDEELDAVSGGWVVRTPNGFLITDGFEIVQKTPQNVCEDYAVGQAQRRQVDPAVISLDDFNRLYEDWKLSGQG